MTPHNQNGLIGFYIIIDINTSIILFLQSMEQKWFSQILEHAFIQTARKHGMHYPPGGAHAWAEAGTAYLSLVLCGLGQSEVRRLHCHARDLYGSVILDCRWYEELKDSCMGGNESTEALLPGKEGTPCRKTLTAGLFLEMLDFCREG